MSTEAVKSFGQFRSKMGGTFPGQGELGDIDEGEDGGDEEIPGTPYAHTYTALMCATSSSLCTCSVP